MYLNRKEDLSVYYFLVDLFQSIPQIKIVDGFPEDELTIPTIAVEAHDINAYKAELGNTKRLKYRTWSIDIFAVNKSQRDDISYKILDALEQCISVYDYDEGFPPTVVTKLGCLQVDDMKLEIIRIFPELTGSLYYRAIITFTAVNN